MILGQTQAAPALALTKLCGARAGGMGGEARPLNIISDLPADRVSSLKVSTAQHGCVQVVGGHQVLPEQIVIFLEAHHVACGERSSAPAPP